MRTLLIVLAVILSPIAPRAAGFDAKIAAAKGETVDFFAWGGSGAINDYIAWAAGEVEARYGIELRHVKLENTADAVAQVLAEKTAGRLDGGTIDLVWINGENFSAMKANGLLHGPFALDLPNFALIDTDANPTTLVDFTVPTEGYESPWGSAQFVLIHDEAADAEPAAHDRGFRGVDRSQPRPLHLPGPARLHRHDLLKAPDAGPPARHRFQRPAAAPTPRRCWPPSPRGLDRHRDALWRQGTSYPTNGPGLHQLFEDNSVDFSFAFNPAEAATYVRDGRFPETTRSYTLKGGTIANTHFVAIPFNANDAAGAEVVANFLLSPKAQAKKQDPAGWGRLHRARPRPPDARGPRALRGPRTPPGDAIARGTAPGPERAAPRLGDGAGEPLARTLRRLSGQVSLQASSPCPGLVPGRKR